MKIHLYYIDRNWQKRGFAKNYNLMVDYDKKGYETWINPFYGYKGAIHIETNKKSDILEYEKLLKNNNFIETKF